MRKVTLEKVTVLRWLGAALPVLLAACAHQPQLLGEPERVWASPRGLDTVAACVIRVLNNRGSHLTPKVTHAKQVIEPGKVYEIRPQGGAVTTETYVVRLEKTGDQITRLALYVTSPWRKEMMKTLSPCGTRS